MKSFACYCQKCRRANSPGDEACAHCGTPLMLVVLPASMRNETVWSDAQPSEHLLERISHLELRLVQVTEQLGQMVDLMLRQADAMQKEQLLVQTLVDALTEAGVLHADKISWLWREKQQREEQQTRRAKRREAARARILADSGGTKLDLFVNLVKEGFKLLDRADEKQGLRTLERAIVIERRNFPLLAFVGAQYFLADKAALAADYLARAHEVFPGDDTVNLLLGVASAEAGELDAAKKLLEPIAEQNSFAANFVLGLIYAKEQRFNQTLHVFKRALGAKQSAENYYLVGSAFAEIKRDKTALKNLQKAIELDPDFADAWFMLGAVYLRLGEEKSAKEALANSFAARDGQAQAHQILRDPQKYHEIADTTLLFSKLAHVSKNLIKNSSPRLFKTLREDIERILNGE